MNDTAQIQMQQIDRCNVTERERERESLLDYIPYQQGLQTIWYYLLLIRAN